MERLMAIVFHSSQRQDEGLEAKKLAENALQLHTLEGYEEISRGFSYELTFLSESHDISFEAVIGKSATVIITLADGSMRQISGIINRFAQGKSDARCAYYSATLVPWTWLLGKSTDTRIFQEKTVLDIVCEVFEKYEFRDYEIRTHTTYDPRDYCVQYQESDLNFINRLLEEEGIFTFFEHTDERHVLILADSSVENKPCPYQEEATCQTASGGWLDMDVVTLFTMKQEIRSSKYTLKDYNFETPYADLKVSVDARENLGPTQSEVYLPSAAHRNRDKGDRLAKLHMEAEEAQMSVFEGSSNCRAFMTGKSFLLLEHFRQDLSEKEYVLKKITHRAIQPVNFLDLVEEEINSSSYENNFECIRKDVPFRPARITPKPIIEGIQTAIVVGPSPNNNEMNSSEKQRQQLLQDQSLSESEKHEILNQRLSAREQEQANQTQSLAEQESEQGNQTQDLTEQQSQQGNQTQSTSDGEKEQIYTDKHGRVKVQFHWDREGSYNDHSSCWIRVSQIWAGAGWGGLYIPRVDQEVVVSFIEGDPDQPLITGCVYHGNNQPPYPLPDEKTKSTIKSNTYFGNGFNELRFDDKAGKEEIYLHGQKNWTIVIENDKNQTIGHDESLHIKHDRNKTIDSNETVQVGQTRNKKIGADENIKIVGNKNEKIEKNHNHKVDQNQNISVKKNVNYKAGTDMILKATKNYELEATNIKITATSSVEIVCGGSSIKITPASIDMKSTTVNISSTTANINC